MEQIDFKEKVREIIILWNEYIIYVKFCSIILKHRRSRVCHLRYSTSKLGFCIAELFKN